MTTTSASPAGIFSAQWIPTDASGRVDRARLAAHIDFERRAGISGILALGSTGQFPHFTVDERKTVLATVAELAAPLTVFANVSHIRPRAAIELGLHAKSLGVPAVALMPPTFYPVSQADMLAYFLHVADAVGLPVMLYNFPELAGTRIEPATVAAFAERAPMVAIKQSGGDFEYHRELIALGREKGFVVMSGADTRLPEAFALGAAGCIGGLVNVVPEVMVEIDRVCRRGEPGDATEPAAAVREIGRILDRLTFPLNVAAGLEARGFEPGAPKAIVSPESRALYREIVAAVAALLERSGLPPR
ncbi:MAG TPA: dihydrodipicolinate synthase family protein [Gemmatimonadaceae bacterium]|nr:dihydrodipicolinate synthase family protein [Gemmatimonadaceae bacterium]